MKIGFCMLLWTTSVGEEHRGLLEDIKATGYDGVEVPVRCVHKPLEVYFQALREAGWTGMPGGLSTATSQRSS